MRREHDSAIARALAKIPPEIRFSHLRGQEHPSEEQCDAGESRNDVDHIGCHGSRQFAERVEGPHLFKQGQAAPEPVQRSLFDVEET